jgi:DNA invertase Pin-like site-specific DNA recombinase
VRLRIPPETIRTLLGVPRWRAKSHACGYSGGSTARPALQRLMADIRDRRIDIVVVYKVDRLTRSLADFAKLVELLLSEGDHFRP